MKRDMYKVLKVIKYIVDFLASVFYSHFYPSISSLQFYCT